jgi:hypothetical protein
MKKNGLFTVTSITLAFALVLTVCKSGNNDDPLLVLDNPTEGIMSEITAKNIFNYEYITGGVKITGFKSAAHLAAYLASTSSASKNVRAGIPGSGDTAAQTLFLCKIGDKYVVAIGVEAFTPTPGDPNTDVTTVVTVIKLAPTITAIAADSFSGSFQNTPIVDIPPAVYDILPTESKAGLEGSIVVRLVDVAAYSRKAINFYRNFPGTKTIGELHSAAGYPPYASWKNRGRALFLDEGLKNEVNDSTAITKNTPLYYTTDAIPKINSYPGLNLDNWPQANSLNGGWENGTYYFRKSADGKALAYNAFGAGDGTRYIPNIWLLEKDGAGTFPVGVWVYFNGSSYQSTLTFTPTELTIDSASRNFKFNYTVSGDTFVCTGYMDVPYTPTFEQLAEIATYNETAFRASHPWIPATSTITPIAATKQGIQYWKQLVQHWISDDITAPFIDDPNVIGTWTITDITIIPEWFDPPIMSDVSTFVLSKLVFDTGGSLTCYQSQTNSFSASWTKNLVKIPNGDNHGNNVAPKYVSRNIGGTDYLFLETKYLNTAYTELGEKPWWVVYKKQ